MLKDDTAPTHVQVELSGCAPDDAHAVFAALRASFASDRAPDDVPQGTPGPGPTVWAATFDTARTGRRAAPARLAAPVTADVQGGYRAVDTLRATLCDAFAVRVVGMAAGDQENEVQLRLDNRTARDDRGEGTGGHVR
ncbi:hypothetical protein [Streptomyces sp. NPDC050560]|uniref:hypothetical protein n=1 Tax=Streptomyces sp. NPDC050560 TaxID=3365630 RepID=UPI0037911409